MQRLLPALCLLLTVCHAAHAAPPTQIYIKNGTGYAADICINGVPQGRIAGWKTAVFLGEGYVQTSKIEKSDSHGGWSRSDPVKVFALWDVDINNQGKASKYAWVEIDVTAAEDANGRTEAWLATDEPVNDSDKNFAQKPIRYDSRICKRSDIPAADTKGAAIKVGKYGAWSLKADDGESWTDHKTGLTWRRGDNGSNLDGDQARSYCSQLLGGWQLPSMNELKNLYRVGETGCGTDRRSKSINCKVVSQLNKLTSDSFYTREPTYTEEVFDPNGMGEYVSSRLFPVGIFGDSEFKEGGVVARESKWWRFTENNTPRALCVKRI